MNALVVFASKGLSAKQVAGYIAEKLICPMIHLNTDFILAEKLIFQNLILVSPTYGDAELEMSMENFLVNSKWSIHHGKSFSVCEMGLYRGYQESTMGSGMTISTKLSTEGLNRRGYLLSIDSVPFKNELYSHVDNWINSL